MKLRFRANSLRFRVNRREVDALASGATLRESVSFPDSSLAYTLQPFELPAAQVSFHDGEIRVNAPVAEVRNWATSETIGLYFVLPAGKAELKVAIEKDLECIDGPLEEADPEAFPRQSGKNC